MAGVIRFVAALAAVMAACPALAQRSTPLQVLHPSGAASDQFGQAVAIDGDTMVVGAPFDDIGAKPIRARPTSIAGRARAGPWKPR